MDELIDKSNKRESLSIYTFKYGLGLAAALFMIHIFGYINNFKFNFLELLNYGVIMAFIIHAVINYRRKFQNGFISYGKALGIAMLVLTFGAFVFSLVNYFFYAFFDREILSVLQRRFMEAFMENPAITNEQIDMLEKVIDFMFKPLMFSFITFFNLIFSGVFFALISSAFLKKTDNSFDATFNK